MNITFKKENAGRIKILSDMQQDESKEAMQVMRKATRKLSHLLKSDFELSLTIKNGNNLQEEL